MAFQYAVVPMELMVKVVRQGDVTLGILMWGRKWGQSENAGINRHRVGDERAPHERRNRSIMTLSHVRVAARVHVR